MSEQPPTYNTRDERVAAQVRQALGPFNDDSRPVAECVAGLAKIQMRSCQTLLSWDDAAVQISGSPLLEPDDRALCESIAAHLREEDKPT